MSYKTMRGIAQTFTLTDGVPLPIKMQGMPQPCVVTLKSAAVARKVEFSTDGGIEYFQPDYDVTTPTMIVVGSDLVLTHIKVTGQAGDTGSVA